MTGFFELFDEIELPLKTVVLFEEFKDDYLRTWHHIPRSQRPPTREPSPESGGQLARLSLRLERLSASYLVEARDFFQGCEKDDFAKWDELTHLAMTSRFLTPDDNYFLFRH